jgi:hypothetical protein
MPAHSELDKLSAYIDGELDGAERSLIDAHLPSCAECRTTLDALRATLSDLATLPQPAPTEQDSWAIRSAIRRSRAPAKRWQRAAWAAGTFAAGAIAFVVFTHGPAKNTGGALEALNNGRSSSAENVEVTTVAGNFDPQSAQARLLDVAGKVPGARALTSGSNTTAPAGAPVAKDESYYSAVLTRERIPTAAIDRCVAAVTRSATEALTPKRYELVTFEKKPAFFLFFSTPERVELWVVTRDRCEVLYFAQTA